VITIYIVFCHLDTNQMLESVSLAIVRVFVGNDKLPFYLQFLHMMFTTVVALTMVWILVAGLGLQGHLSDSGDFHWVSDGFTNYPVLSTLILGIASHLVFAMRVYSGYKYISTNDNSQRALVVLLLPLAAACGLITLRFDVARGASHAVPAGLSIVLSILFYYVILNNLPPLAQWIWRICMALFVVLLGILIFYVVQEGNGMDTSDLWTAGGAIEYVLIELILALDLCLMYNLSAPNNENDKEEDESTPLTVQPPNQKFSIFQIHDRNSLFTLRERL